MSVSKNDDLDQDNWLYTKLSNADSYSQVIDRYINKQTKKRNFFTQGLDGISFEALAMHKKQLSEILANLFEMKQIQAPLLTKHIIKRNNKERIVYTADTLENIFENTVLHLLLPKLQEYGTDGLYSFFPKTSAIKTLQKISSDLKQLPGEIYVLRTDIVQYTNSIPIDDSSQIWPILNGFFEFLGLNQETHKYWYNLIRSMIQTKYKEQNGEIATLTKGLPMGRPISTLVAAIYLRNLDKIMSNIDNCHYFRFGDDIVWLSNDRDSFDYGDKCLEQELMLLKLPRHPDKERYIFLSRSGAKYSTDTKFKGSKEVEYLGLSIMRNGLIRLSPAHMKRIKQLLELRIQRANRLLKTNLSAEERIKSIVKMINKIIKPDNSTLKNSLSLFNNVTDYGQLKEMDFFIASRIIMTCTNNYTLKAFKQFSYRWIRTACGLISLCKIRVRNYD